MHKRNKEITNSVKANPQKAISGQPRHIAIIMDGNGRWAKARKLPRIFGHRQGIKSVKKIVEECSRLGIGVLTLYAFSTENWARPQAEVSGLMLLLEHYLKKELKNLNDNNVKLMVSGDISKLPARPRQALYNSIKETKNNTGLVLNLALNYGSRQEILTAVNNIIDAGIKNVDAESFSGYLYTAGLPDPDLLIRTSGEERISNFLLWQIAYCELYFTDVLWPDFDESELHKAIKEFLRRERRFGAVTPAEVN